MWRSVGLSEGSSFMWLQEVHAALNRLEAKGGTVRILRAEEAAGIDELDHLLGLQLPTHLKDFYGEFAALQVGTDEFLWKKRLPELYKRLRTRQTWIPSNFLPILLDGVGGYYWVVCAEANLPMPPKFGWVIHNPVVHEHKRILLRHFQIS